MKKIELLKEICDWYNYGVTVYEDGIIICSGYFGEYKDNIFENVDEALKDWLITLEQTNKDCIEDGVEKLWQDNEIELIKNL